MNIYFADLNGSRARRLPPSISSSPATCSQSNGHYEWGNCKTARWREYEGSKNGEAEKQTSTNLFNDFGLKISCLLILGILGLKCNLASSKTASFSCVLFAGSWGKAYRLEMNSIQQRKRTASIASAIHIDPESSADTFSSGSFGDASYCFDFSCDTKWWLKGSTGEHFASLEEELDLNHGLMNSFFEDTKCKKKQEFVDLMETGGGEYTSYGNGIQGKLNEMYFEPVEFPWVPSKKSQPWWRTTTDKDELALLVATNSLDHIQNCDLPPPQKVHNVIHLPSGGGKTQRSGSIYSHPGPLVEDIGFQESAKTSWKQGVSGKTEQMEHGFGKSGSYSSTDKNNVSSKSADNDLNKAEILEALRHSQTRAREAEKAAREAYTEKDHMITLLFRQASELFAYKQWFQLLQLEALYLQIKNKEKQISGRNLRKKWQRSRNGGVGRYVVALALGFSLIGAGLLLGWTVGWLLPF
ncbi:PREDICTED: uncharacterized protein LOC104825884 isoform X3 [Tarenaya hassleriana]|uniref:uncharacterized protein LOC104825884 isoform X3 n=1 Tax=Tarenaya hassleriana TaxID=28532 RepID=UPI00053C91F0|nr:PREDICTED: uncharacterized protein LOC104825884 isoform X3 [Tarenaya hassleriana]